MKPWERRLGDLAQLLQNCAETYFAPDRFRQNTNQFLQTSRTVTFIVQKNKSEIPDFACWYNGSVLAPWSTDPIMSWAKNARNVIEKEGDLNMQSTLRASVLFSYLSAEDMVVETTRKELLQADLNKLLHFAKTKLPSAIADAAILKIERRWIANSLPDRELLHAMTYAYARHHEVCTSLASHLGSKLEPSVPHPTSLDPNVNDAASARFIRFRKGGIGRNSSTRIGADPEFRPPPYLIKLKAELGATTKPASLTDIVERHAKMAKANFEHHGNHVPMLALYDKNWNQIDFMSTAFSDQSEKYLFWRNVADRASYLRAFAMVWTCESWIRDMEGHQDQLIRELPIIGEQLHVVGADATESHKLVAWNIVRATSAGHPTLEMVEPDDMKRRPDQVYFVRTVVGAMKAAHSYGVG